MLDLPRRLCGPVMAQAANGGCAWGELGRPCMLQGGNVEGVLRLLVWHVEVQELLEEFTIT